MNTKTDLVTNLFEKYDSEKDIPKLELENLLINLNSRGIWTMLGMRTTKGSQDDVGKLFETS